MLYQLSYVRARPRVAQSLLRGIAPNAHPADHLSMRRPNAWRSEEGQTMAEYGVILAVITPAIVAVIALMAFTMADHFQAIVSIIT
jgi:Flp pilus assembly pilin Flp